MITSAALRLIGYGAAALAVVGVVWWLGNRIRLSYEVEEARAGKAEAESKLVSYRAQVEQEARRAVLAQAAEDRRNAAMNARVEALTAENSKLHQIILRLASTEEHTDEKGVTHTRIAGPWWLCHAAQLGRDPADIAACQARAGDGSVPDAVGH